MVPTVVNGKPLPRVEYANADGYRVIGFDGNVASKGYTTEAQANVAMGQLMAVYGIKSVADRELVDAVRTVAAGDVYVQPTAARALARGLARRDGNAEERARFEKLTDREQSVLKMVAEGFTAPEIGEHLTISPKTVDTYKQRIGEKVGLSHRTDYVKFALKLGLLKNDA
jgi:DNA-binding NarL/FixJ family response regulator